MQSGAELTHVSAIGIFHLANTLLLKSVLEDFVQSMGVERDGDLNGTGGTTELLVEGMGVLLSDFRNRRVPSTQMVSSFNGLTSVPDLRLGLERVLREVCPVPARVSKALEICAAVRHWCQKAG